MFLSLQNTGMGPVDWKKTAIHFVEFLLGTFILAGLEAVSHLNFGQYNFIAYPVAGALITLAHKTFDGVRS